jgi:hypothetical protein
MSLEVFRLSHELVWVPDVSHTVDSRRCSGNTRIVALRLFAFAVMAGSVAVLHAQGVDLSAACGVVALLSISAVQLVSLDVDKSSGRPLPEIEK